MEVVKRINRNLLVLLLMLIFTLPLWVGVVPTKYTSLLTGRIAVVDRVLCNFSTKVNGRSMNPLITSGSKLDLNRCFKKKDLTIGTIVLFEDGSGLRLGVIRHVLPLDLIVYKVSDEKAPELLHDVIITEISAINKSVDTNKSKYQAKLETEAFILDTSKYLSDIYLAKIPKGVGIESAAIEKTALFSRQTDKFCSVIFPKQTLSAVDTEIINNNTRETTFLGSDIIFGISPNPNVNCMEFGSGPGMLNLGLGNYQYRFLMNHQVLAKIQFKVKN